MAERRNHMRRHCSDAEQVSSLVQSVGTKLTWSQPVMTGIPGIPGIPDMRVLKKNCAEERVSIALTPMRYDATLAGWSTGSSYLIAIQTLTPCAILRTYPA